MGGGERVEQRGPVLHTFRARGMRVYAPKAEGRRAERERERESGTVSGIGPKNYGTKWWGMTVP